MISIDDCIALCGLTRDEVLAVAEHEHVPEMIAAAIASRLLAEPDGCRRIGAMIADDVDAAEATGDQPHVEWLKHTLKVFVETHPEARASRRASACLAAIEDAQSAALEQRSAEGGQQPPRPALDR